MPDRWVIPFADMESWDVAPRVLHAVVSQWVDADHWQSPKPWSVVPLRPVEGVPVIEVATLLPDGGTRLRERVTPGVAVRFGSHGGSVLAPPRRVAEASWVSLAAGDAAHRWEVSFMTPTTFRRRHHFSPWPDPAALLRSLSVRWESFAPPGAQLPRLDHRQVAEVRVDDVDGRAYDMRLGVGDDDGRVDVVKGFVGRVVLSCADPVAARIVGSLLRFGEYAGAGSYPAHGLGVMRVRD